jgi:hypothetical protein
VRDPAVKPWPAALCPRDVTPVMADASFSGGAPFSGAPQIVASSNGRWRFIYHDVRFKAENILTARALLAYLARMRKIYVGPQNGIYSPARRAGVTTPTLRNFTNGFAFTNGFGFAQRTADCTLAAAAKIGATQIPVTNSVIAPLSAGDYFEIDGRVHLIEEISGSAWTIWPSLRADCASGTILEIDDPRMLARLDPKSQALACQMQVGWTGLATFEFIEEHW